MRTLRDFLLAEAKEDEQKQPAKKPTSIPIMQEYQWDDPSLGKGLSPGRLSDEVKALLNIQSAKGAVVSGDNPKLKAANNPAGFLKDLRLVKKDDFFDVMGQIPNTTPAFGQFFEKTPPGRFMIESLKGRNKEKVVKLTISSVGMQVLSKDTQLVRFYKFWIDSIVYAAMGQRGVKLSSKLKYKRRNNELYVRCPE